ncbi:MAG TPA: ferredoxin domain-containing protein, partial [Paludibacteraceae bacterium]|nr:ferredoxin domain-containing protein [Paludibacteraceae bacterium]
VDTRVMFSVGRVAKEMGLLPGCSSIFGIPLSCSSKNPFFDRISKTPAPK